MFKKPQGTTRTVLYVSNVKLSADGGSEQRKKRVSRFVPSTKRVSLKCLIDDGKVSFLRETHLPKEASPRVMIPSPSETFLREAHP